MSTQLGKSLGVRGDTVEVKGAGSADRIVAGGIGTDASNDGLTIVWYYSCGPEIESKSNIFVKSWPT